MELDSRVAFIEREGLRALGNFDEFRIWDGRWVTRTRLETCVPGGRLRMVFSVAGWPGDLLDRTGAVLRCFIWHRENARCTDGDGVRPDSIV